VHAPSLEAASDQPGPPGDSHSAGAARLPDHGGTEDRRGWRPQGTLDHWIVPGHFRLAAEAGRPRFCARWALAPPPCDPGDVRRSVGNPFAIRGSCSWAVEHLFSRNVTCCLLWHRPGGSALESFPKTALPGYFGDNGICIPGNGFLRP